MVLDPVRSSPLFSPFESKDFLDVPTVSGSKSFPLSDKAGARLHHRQILYLSLDKEFLPFDRLRRGMGVLFPTKSRFPELQS